MAYNRHIDHTEQELRELRKVYGQDSIDRFFDGLISGEIRTEEQVIEFTNQIRESDGKENCLWDSSTSMPPILINATIWYRIS